MRRVRWKLFWPSLNQKIKLVLLLRIKMTNDSMVTESPLAASSTKLWNSQLNQLREAAKDLDAAKPNAVFSARLSEEWLQKSAFRQDDLIWLFKYRFQLPYKDVNGTPVLSPFEMDSSGEFDEGKPNEKNFLDLGDGAKILPLGRSYNTALAAKTAIRNILKEYNHIGEYKSLDDGTATGDATRQAPFTHLMNNLKEEWDEGGIVKWKASSIELTIFQKLHEAVIASNNLNLFGVYVAMVLGIHSTSTKSSLCSILVEQIVPLTNDNNDIITLPNNKIPKVLKIVFPKDTYNKYPVIKMISANEGTATYLCPVFLLTQYLIMTKIKTGYLFNYPPRKVFNPETYLDKGIPQIFALAGMDSKKMNITPHSLRRTGILHAIISEASTAEIMELSGFKDHKIVVLYNNDARSRSQDRKRQQENPSAGDPDLLKWVWRPVKTTRFESTGLHAKRNPALDRNAWRRARQILEKRRREESTDGIITVEQTKRKR